MAKHSITCAKPDDEDMDVMEMLMSLDNLFDGRGWTDEDSWREWDDDDKTKRALLSCEKEIRDLEGLSESDEVDNRLVIYEFVKRLFINYPSSLRRMHMAAVLAMDNCFDPDKDYIDYKPAIQKGYTFYVNNEKMVDEWYEKNIPSEEEEESKTRVVNDVFCKRRNWKFDESVGYTFENEEVIITINFEKHTLDVTNKSDGRFVRRTKEDLRMYDILYNLKTFGLEHCMGEEGLKW